jgi:hypothetical protein
MEQNIPEVDVPPVEVTDVDKLEFATEVACTALLERAIKDGLLPMRIVPPLMQLPDQSVTQKFVEACRAVIGCLKSMETAGQ